MVRKGFAALALAGALYTVPALADVKAGVDAWSRGDYAGAIREWRQPAIDGDADAQFNMGQAYKLGRGVPVDLKLAEDWYRKAALQGHFQAEDNYGLILFQNGDRQRALPYIEKSAGRGEPRAQYVLGTALFNGDMVKKDWVRAYALMTRASAAGIGAASASLAQMDRYIPLDQRQKGTVMARELEQLAQRPAMLPSGPGAEAPVRNTRPAPSIRTTDIPPSQPVEIVTITPQPTPKANPKPPVVATVKPVKAVPVSGKGWRVQLGAFGDENKARALWPSLEGRISGLSGLQPYLVKAGPVTRLQAGPIANKAGAERVCASARASGQACLTVAP